MNMSKEIVINPQQKEENYISSSSSNSNSEEIKYYISGLDYYPEGGSLLINFGDEDEEVLESNALVLVGVKDNKLSSIEILFDSENVINRLNHIFSENVERA